MMKKRGMKKKSVRGLEARLAQSRELVRAIVLSVSDAEVGVNIEGRHLVRLRDSREAIVLGDDTKLQRSLIACQSRVDSALEEWTSDGSEHGELSINLIPVGEIDKQLIRLLNPGDNVGLWLLTERQEHVQASLSVTVAPGGAGILLADTGSVAVDGLGRENKKKLKKGDLVAVAGSAILDKQTGKALEESLQEMINSGGVTVEDLVNKLDGFDVKDVTYEEAVAGFSTITNVFGLGRAALTQRWVDRKKRLIYLDINRKELPTARALAHNNKNIVASGRFDRVEIEPTLWKMREALQREKLMGRGGEGLVDEFDGKPKARYFASVFDRDGNAFIYGQPIERVLTTRTDGSELGWRFVLSGAKGLPDLYTPDGIKQIKFGLDNLFVVLEKTEPLL